MRKRDVHVAALMEPRDLVQRRFHDIAPTREGFRNLFEARVDDLDGISSMHLMAHLWWSDTRCDFSTVHAGMIDERWIRETDVTYAHAARPFLPGLD